MIIIFWGQIFQNLTFVDLTNATIVHKTAKEENMFRISLLMKTVCLHQRYLIYSMIKKMFCLQRQHAWTENEKKETCVNVCYIFVTKHSSFALKEFPQNMYKTKEYEKYELRSIQPFIFIYSESSFFLNSRLN